MQEPSENPPKDRYYLVYMIFLLHGIGILMPWNMFITSHSYFVDYKMSENYTGEGSSYATYFLSSVGFASHIPNVIFHWINVFINIRGSVTPRILLTINVEVALFVVTIILAVLDTSDYLTAFFWSTIATIVILNMSSGIYQNTLFGLASSLPLKYTGALILGCNISGVLVSFIELLIQIIATRITTAAIYYFVTALVVLLTCLATYFALFRLKFYTSYKLLAVTPTGSSDGPIPYWQIFKAAFPQLFNVFFLFFVTLSVFPALQANIKKSNASFIIPEKYYVNVMCFITFNTMATFGSLCSNWINCPSPKRLLIPVLLRGLFIPFFFFCNYQPIYKVRKVPVLIPNDWVYWIGGILIGFTSGYLSTKAMMYTTGSVQKAYGSVAGMFGAAVLVTGIFVGATFSMIFPCMVELFNEGRPTKKTESDMRVETGKPNKFEVENSGRKLEQTRSPPF